MESEAGKEVQGYLMMWRQSQQYGMCWQGF